MRVQKNILFLLLLVSIPAISQTLVQGVVLDINSDPLAAVNVHVKNFGLQATSDSLGKFEIFVPPNKYLELSKSGYFSNSLKINKNIVPPFIFRLKEKKAGDNTVLVKGTVVDYNTRVPLVGAVVTIPEISFQTETDVLGKFEVEIKHDAVLLIDYGKTESFEIAYGGERVFELFKSVSPTTVGSQSWLSKDQFNKGNIHQPLQLIQSKVPGVMMSMGGGNNPFGRFAIRVRGVSSLNGEQPFSNTIYNTVDPLIVVDGMPNADISILDPLTIESINIIKDGTAAKYGIRGASGVLEITTNRASASGIQYHTFLGMDYLNQTMQFLDADAYPGNNYGDKTDWFKAVSQRAYTHTHHLSFSKKQNGTAYQFALVYKDAEGILKKQGYHRLQVNGHFQQTAFDKKMKLEAMIRGSTQDDNYSQPLAFRYAQNFNPTAPILEDDSSYDGYFEQEIVDHFNPVAMLDLSTHQGDQRQLFTKLSAQYQLLPDWSIVSDYSAENYQTINRAYYSKNSLWIGRDQNGFAQQNKKEVGNQFFNIHLNLTSKLGILRSLKIGHQYQVQKQQSFSASAGDFLTDAFSFNDLTAAGDFASGLGKVHSNKSKQRLAAFYGLTQLNWQNTFLVDAGLRIEGSSLLGKENRWSRFPFIAIAANLGNTADGFFKKNKVQLKASFGITGNLPYTDNLNLKKYSTKNSLVYFNGDFIPGYDIANIGNPSLAWEQKREWNVGLHIQPTIFNKSLSFDIDVYSNEIKGIIQQLQSRLSYTYFANVSRIKNKGMEATLEMEVLRKRNISWQTSLVMASTTSTLAYYPRAKSVYPNQRNPNSPNEGGCCKEGSVLLENESRIGDLFLLDVKEISSTGQWIFEDVDKNGVQDARDKTIAGNGLPEWTVGWNNTIRLGNFNLSLFFRGAFGHNILNTTRQLTENPNIITTSNVLASTFEGETARLTDFPEESSYYVEKASFIRLDNAQVSYTLKALEKLPFRSLKFYVAANNIFTITGYKGWDPDFRLQSGNDVLAIGYEFQNLYLPTKSWAFGLQFGIK